MHLDGLDEARTQSYVPLKKSAIFLPSASLLKPNNPSSGFRRGRRNSKKLFQEEYKLVLIPSHEGH